MTSAHIKIEEITAKSVLVKSGLPDTDLVVNPYVGCQFSCAYCYASFMGRFVGESIADWGKYVYAKTNAVELFEKELRRVRAKDGRPTIFLSSVTDPYQGVEKKYRLTRGIVELLAREPYPGRVGILTKSPLVLRDIDLLQRLPACEVGVTITTDEDRLGRELEAFAPAASARLETLSALNAANVETYAFIGPLLPYYAESPDKLERLVERIARTGVREAYVEHLNPSRYIAQRIEREMAEQAPTRAASLRRENAVQARAALEARILSLLERHGIRLRLGRAIVHSS
ncbi:MULTISPECIES: SPL family radical SAM protein [Burkholderia cepacia complex]|uniref:Radical SAM protein n=2 Tax=Burkholderia cepacia complex TaxID=87882 RepID=A0A1B4PUX9_BURCE|nr:MULTISPECIES: radical SAM protein [Burkholderia cepacia complex]AOK17717.1 radical SAM protein [Burkholderia cepacia]AOK24453.1 radical SAM protein [Burkholderia ubonensis]KVL20841.1 radical SAM protein [Burkholderia ubonensis]KVN84113.1 radical SAM protein [Burkholderia ubonensis]KVQ40372.1 radical SAM protein [Burkholderia ubonensis]